MTCLNAQFTSGNWLCTTVGLRGLRMAVVLGRLRRKTIAYVQKDDSAKCTLSHLLGKSSAMVFFVSRLGRVDGFCQAHGRSVGTPRVLLVVDVQGQRRTVLAPATASSLASAVIFLSWAHNWGKKVCLCPRGSVSRQSTQQNQPSRVRKPRTAHTKKKSSDKGFIENNRPQHTR